MNRASVRISLSGIAGSPKDAGHRSAYWRARLKGSSRRRGEQRAYSRWRLAASAFECLFRFDDTASRMAALAAEGVRSIVLADLGRNIRRFVIDVRNARLIIACIADNRFAGKRRHYLGIPIRTLADGVSLALDAIVISNTSPAHAAASGESLRQPTALPVVRWFGYDLAPSMTGTIFDLHCFGSLKDRAIT